MKIYVKTAEGKVIKFPLPMSLVDFGLVCGRLGIRLGKKHISEETLKLLEATDFSILRSSFKELKKYKGLELVDVKSSSGEEVRIIV